MESSFFFSDYSQVLTMSVLYSLQPSIYFFLVLINSLTFADIALVWKLYQSKTKVYKDFQIILTLFGEYYQISGKQILIRKMFAEGEELKIQNNQMPIMYNFTGQQGPQPTHNLKNSTTQSPQSTTIYGSSKMTSFLKFFIPFMLAAPLIAYYMAVKKGQQHKFPHPSISDAACHYPQNIQFRLIMASSGPFISLIYWVLFSWVRRQKQATQYQGPTFSYLHYIGQVSVWCYMTAMCTIDGKWYPDLHTNCAIFFFITLFIIVLTQTLVIRQIYQWDSSIISRKSYLIKMIFGVYVAMVWVYCVYGLLTEKQDQNDDEDVFIVILEWNSVYVCIFWLLSFMPEWRDVRLTLTQHIKSY